MSSLITGLVWLMDLPQTEKFVLLAYAEKADQDGIGFGPSYTKVARLTGYTRQGVIGIVNRLQDKGVMIIQDPGGPGGKGRRNRTNEWRIDPFAVSVKQFGRGSQYALTRGSQQPLTRGSQQPMTTLDLVQDQDLDQSPDPSTLLSSKKPTTVKGPPKAVRTRKLRPADLVYNAMCTGFAKKPLSALTSKDYEFWAWRINQALYGNDKRKPPFRGLMNILGIDKTKHDACQKMAGDILDFWVWYRGKFDGDLLDCVKIGEQWNTWQNEVTSRTTRSRSHPKDCEICGGNGYVEIIKVPGYDPRRAKPEDHQKFKDQFFSWTVCPRAKQG